MITTTLIALTTLATLQGAHEQTALHGSLGLELFPGYRLIQVEGDTLHNAFRLERGLLKAGFHAEGFSANLTLESVASASDGSVFGVAGQSVLLRLREASASYDWAPWLSIKAGIVPTLTVPALERGWDHRVLSPSAAERTQMLSPADLGATVRVSLPDAWGWVGVGVYNGDGYDMRELNQGKSFEAAFQLNVLAPLEAPTELNLTGSYWYGSVGPTDARSDRLSAALSWTGYGVGVGASMTYAWGVADHGGREGLVVAAWARANPWKGLLVAARYSHWMRDIDIDGDLLERVLGSVGYRITGPLEVHLGMAFNMPGERYATAVPYDDGWGLFALIKVDFEGRFAMTSSVDALPEQALGKSEDDAPSIDGEAP